MVLLTALAGSLLGFLYWNRSRARLFMGDCGSLFIGGVLGATSLVPIYNAPLAFINPAVIVVLVLIVPLFDTGFVLALRRLAGRKATKGGTDHVSHRLVSLGFSERSAVRILYLLGIAGGTTAWVLMSSRGAEPMLPLVAAFGVLLVLVGIYLARVPAYNAEDFIALQKSSFAPFLKDLAFRWHAAEVLLDLVLITVCYYVAYRLRFEGEGLDNFLPYFTASLPVVLGCKLAALYASGLYQRSWDTFGLRDVTAGTARRRPWIAGLGAHSCLFLPARRVFTRRLRSGCAAVKHRCDRHTGLLPRDEPRRRNEEQAKPSRARLRSRRLRSNARARDARQPEVEHEPYCVHR